MVLRKYNFYLSMICWLYSTVVVAHADSVNSVTVEHSRVALNTDSAPRAAPLAWRQTEGPRATVLAREGAGTAFLVPEGSVGQRLVFERVGPGSGGAAVAQRRVYQVDACYRDVGVIFRDCVDPSWRAFAADQPDEPNASRGLSADRTKDLSSHVDWAVVESDDSGRGRVLDIRFSDSETQNGFFAVATHVFSDPDTPNAWLDLSAFRGGELTFDIKVMDFGRNLNGMEVKLDCGAGCSSGVFGLPITRAREWQHFRIEVDDLVATGLDLSRVQTGLQIFPVWNDQRGVHLQLDNVRWEANIPPPMSEVLL